ncbi:hypothetical protein DKV09_16445 [Salmonella enterica subsp. enterica serovar Durham]|nr:hypothetical protein [Salmonella enterica subsp. enterica serovar Durham]
MTLSVVIKFNSCSLHVIFCFSTPKSAIFSQHNNRQFYIFFDCYLTVEPQWVWRDLMVIIGMIYVVP